MTSVDDGTSSLYKMSDAVMHNCEPCGHAGVVKEATDYCCDCDEYLCEICTNTHRGSKLSKGHKVVSMWDILATGGPAIFTAKITSCESHGSKEIEWYCEDHCAMFCDGCKFTRHRRCKLTRVSEMAETSTHIQQLSEIEGDFCAMKTQIDAIKKTSEQCGVDIKTIAESCEVDVKKFKKKIVAWAEHIEKKMLVEIREASLCALDTVSEDQRGCDSLSEQAKEVKKVAANAKFLDKSRRIVATHQLSKILTNMKETTGGISREQFTFSMEFKTNRAIIELLDSISHIGTLDSSSVNCRKSPMRSDRRDSKARSFRDMSVVASTAVKVPPGRVSGSAFLPDGRLVLVQYETAKVLLLDRDMAVKSELGLQPHPWDVAVTGNTEVTVTVPGKKTLQFITVGTAGLQLGRIITMDRYCWGVYVYNSHIYVSVHDNPGNGCVNVMDMAGVVIHWIAVDAGGHGVLQKPYYVAACRSRVYVSDRDAGVISCYTLAGAEVYRVKDGTMERPCGILPDGEGNLLVCWTGSHEVHLLKPNGTRHSVIASSRDGVKCPRSISYRGSDDTTVVAGDITPFVTKLKVKFQCLYSGTSVNRTAWEVPRVSGLERLNCKSKVVINETKL